MTISAPDPIRTQVRAHQIFAHPEKDIIKKIKKYLSSILPYLDTTNADGYPLPKHRQKHIIDIATSRYLWGWLSTADDLKMNLHNFTEKYIVGKLPSNAPSSSQSTIIDKDIVNQEYHSAYIALKRLNVLIAGQRQVAIGENRASKVVTNDNHVSEYEHKLSAEELWMVEAIKSKHLDLLSLYFDRKELLRPSTRGAGNTPLSQAYQSYCSLFERISTKKNSTIEKIPANELDDLEYIVNCIMLHQIEYPSHFLLAASLAKYMKDHSIPPDFDKYANNLQYLFPSIAEADNQHIGKSYSELQMPYISYEILLSPEDIKYVFEDSPVAENFWSSFCFDMIVLHDLLTYAFKIYPPNKISIAKEDYVAIRHFYEYDFPIGQIYDSVFKKIFDKKGNFNGIDLGDPDSKTSDTCYDYIRKLYQFLIEYTEENAYCPGNQPRNHASLKLPVSKKPTKNKSS